MASDKELYEGQLNILLNDNNIFKDNRAFFKEFFEKEEYKLKRSNGLRELDSSTYKTLYSYTNMFKNLNVWFKNKAWKDITKQDFKQFYDDFEEDRLVGLSGKPIKDKKSFYNKVIRSKPFEMLGKADIVKEVMEFHQTNEQEEVRFIDEAEVRKIINVMISPDHKALAWLAFDIGENINALLQLKKSDFKKQQDQDTGIPEYRINLRKETLKRSRTPRSEITNFEETVEFLDLILRDLNEDDKLFKFEYRNAKKILDRAVNITKVRCVPKGQKVTWKDLRSSMACDLLKKDWTIDEINRRLGHKPSSREIDKYVNFLAVDGKKPKRKVYEHNLAKIQKELEATRDKEKLSSQRMESLKQLIDEQQAHMKKIEEERGSSDDLMTKLVKEVQKVLLKKVMELGLTGKIGKV